MKLQNHPAETHVKMGDQDLKVTRNASASIKIFIINNLGTICNRRSAKLNPRQRGGRGVKSCSRVVERVVPNCSKADVNYRVAVTVL